MIVMSREDHEAERELFRQAAIEGLDEAAKDFAIRRFRRDPSEKIEGIRDGGLKALFAATDAAFDDMLARYGFEVQS